MKAVSGQTAHQASIRQESKPVDDPPAGAVPDLYGLDTIGIHAMRWTGNHPVTPHRHDFIEIALLMRGSCLHAWQGVSIRLVPGDLFVVAPGEEHAFRIEGETTIYNCLFRPSGLGGDWAVLQAEPALQHLLVLEPFFRTEAGRQEILHLDRAAAERLEALWAEMVRECEYPQAGQTAALKGLLLQLLVRIGRAWNQMHPDMPHLHDARRNLLAQAVADIDGRTGEDLSLEALAARCHLSQGHFRKQFREVTGMAPLEYIQRHRISVAQALLMDTDLSVTAVAEQVGLPDPNYFSRLFRRLVGVTPSTFRKSGHVSD